MAEDAAEYARLKALLERLAEESSASRDALLQDILADEPELGQRVQRMLSNADENFLEGNLFDVFDIERGTIDETDAVSRLTRQAGSQIGPFILERVLGEGGMGIVYLARQQEPVERIVALKLISTHATQSQRIRFERESMALARLAHPNVAVMYQSGISDTGEPYVAMEYIEGLPISNWCREHRVPLRQRLELFLGACRGVAHAHEKGVLHRDIKPSNILVTEIDGQATAKVIDFGIAGLMDADSADIARLTRQQLLGTPAYMSPESVKVADRDSLDARSDVYALGIVLFELLVGRTPHATENLPLAEWVHFLSTAEAPSIAKVYADLPEDFRLKLAAQMQTTPRLLERRLQPDLDAILHKALALEPSQRYASSREFGEDLRRHLSGHAVLAHPPSRLYATRKLVQRHWLIISSVGLLIVVLSGGILARSIEVERTRLALNESLAISDFLVDLLEHASPFRIDDHTAAHAVTLQDIIDQAASEMDERFADQPAVRERFLHTLGRVFGERGQYQQSIDLLREALAMSEQSARVEKLDLARLLSDLGSSMLGLMQIEQAEPILLRGMALAESLEEEQPLLVAELSHSLGNLFLAKLQFTEAETYHKQALILRQENLPDDDILIAISSNELATTLINSWDIDRALPYAEQALARFEEKLPAGHHWIGIAQNNLSVIMTRQGRYADAVTMLRKALQDTIALLGEQHLSVADYWHNIAINLAELGEHEQAMAAMEKHLDILEQVLGPKAVRTLEARHEIAHMAFFNEAFEAALTGYRDILHTHQEIMGERSVHALDTELDVVKALIELEGFTEADKRLERVIPLLDAIAGPDNQRSLRGRLLLARSIGRQGDPDAATAQLDDIYDKGLEVLPGSSLLMGEIYEELTRQEIAKGAYQTAITWGHKALDHWSIFHSNYHVPQAHELLGKANLASGNITKAHDHLAEAVARYQQLLPEHHPRRIKSEKTLIEIESAAH